MKYLLLYIALITVSCGKGSESPSQSTTSPSSNVSNSEPTTSIFIIGGQSNAVGILDAAKGLERDPISAEIDTPTKKIVGYAVGGTSITFWNDLNNSKPLLALVSKYCSPNTTFIWDQGENDTFNSDSGPTQGDYSNFVVRTEKFLTTVIETCPQISIKLIQIREINNRPLNQVNSIRQDQTNFGYPLFNFDYLPSADSTNTHYFLDGYNTMITEITK